MAWTMARAGGEPCGLLLWIAAGAGDQVTSSASGHAVPPVQAGCWTLRIRPCPRPLVCRPSHCPWPRGPGVELARDQGVWNLALHMGQEDDDRIKTEPSLQDSGSWGGNPV